VLYGAVAVVAVLFVSALAAVLLLHVVALLPPIEAEEDNDCFRCLPRAIFLPALPSLLRLRITLVLLFAVVVGTAIAVGVGLTILPEAGICWAILVEAGSYRTALSCCRCRRSRLAVRTDG